uniref:Apple domain-containing protein n=1 Tax=Macrostomum lignano TaxID=282301 RepID=A0A1I8F3V0_9PLAT
CFNESEISGPSRRTSRGRYIDNLPVFVRGAPLPHWLVETDFRSSNGEKGRRNRILQEGHHGRKNALVALRGSQISSRRILVTNLEVFETPLDMMNCLTMHHPPMGPENADYWEDLYSFDGSGQPQEPPVFTQTHPQFTLPLTARLCAPDERFLQEDWDVEACGDWRDHEGHHHSGSTKQAQASPSLRSIREGKAATSERSPGPNQRLELQACGDFRVDNDTGEVIHYPDFGRSYGLAVDMQNCQFVCAVSRECKAFEFSQNSFCRLHFISYSLNTMYAVRERHRLWQKVRHHDHFEPVHVEQPVPPVLPNAAGPAGRDRLLPNEMKKIEKFLIANLFVAPFVTLFVEPSVALIVAAVLWRCLWALFMALFVGLFVLLFVALFVALFVEPSVALIPSVAADLCAVWALFVTLLFVALFMALFVALFVEPSVALIVALFVALFVTLIVALFVALFVTLFAALFVAPFVELLAALFVGAFVELACSAVLESQPQIGQQSRVLFRPRADPGSAASSIPHHIAAILGGSSAAKSKPRNAAQKQRQQVSDPQPAAPAAAPQAVTSSAAEELQLLWASALGPLQPGGLLLPTTGLALLVRDEENSMEDDEAEDEEDRSSSANCSAGPHSAGSDGGEDATGKYRCVRCCKLFSTPHGLEVH